MQRSEMVSVQPSTIRAESHPGVKYSPVHYGGSFPFSQQLLLVPWPVLHSFDSETFT
jgi:hypothetical protein